MFSDFNQSLYHDAEEMQNWPDVTFKLVHNCRNPIGINTATNTICGTDFRSMPGMTEGLPPTVSLVKSEKMAALQAWATAYELYPRGGSVILSPFALDNSCMGGADRVWHKLELTTDLAKLGEGLRLLFYDQVVQGVGGSSRDSGRYEPTRDQQSSG